MTAIKTVPYCQLGAYDFTEEMYSEGIESSGGQLEIEEIKAPSIEFSDLITKGRGKKTYKMRMASDDRTIVEEFARQAESLEDGDPFFPFEAARWGEVGKCSVSVVPRLYVNNWYNSEAIVILKDPWLYGPDKGIDYQRVAVIPYVSEQLTNEGLGKTPISYIHASGGSSYIENLSVRITPLSSAIEMDRKLILCEKMMRNDSFKLGWRGDILHSYSTVFKKSWGSISLDLHGMVSGGIQSGESVILSNGDYVLMPFYGPHLITGDPGAAELRFNVTALTGDAPECQIAFEEDLSDMDTVEHDDISIGENVIYPPDTSSKSFVAFGVKAGEAGTVTISELSGQVKRFVSMKKIPYADDNESFKIRVEAETGTLLNGLHVLYNDRYYY